MKILDGLFIKNLGMVLKGIKGEYLSSNIKGKSSFRIMSYQFDFKPFSTPDEAIYFINARIREILRYLPRIVVFPRYTANLFLGLLPFSKKRLHTEKGLELSSRFYTILKSFYIELVNKIGKITGVTFVSGTVFSEEEEIVVIYAGDDVHVFTNEDSTKVVNFEGYKLAFLFPDETMDYKKPRLLQEMDVEVFITSENWEDENEWVMRKGMWARSQTLGIFGINSAMVGNIFGKEFFGTSFVSAPAVLTKNFTGFVVKLNDHKEKGVAIADINMDVIEEYSRSLPKTYRKYWSFTWGGNS